MTARVYNCTLTNGLNIVDTTAIQISICSADPDNYTQATTTSPTGFLIGYKTFAAGGAFGSPTSTSNGRAVSSVAVSGGIVVSTGIATWWAVVTGSSILADNQLSAASTFTSTNNSWIMPTFTITLPNSSS